MRKYEIESQVTITVSPLAFGRQRELSELSNAEAEGCHLYIVSRRPRISADPSSVEFDGEYLRMDLAVQSDGDFTRYPVTARHGLGDGSFTWRSKWPHDMFEIVDQNGDVAIGGHASLYIQGLTELPDNLYKQEVLYIGQAFGRTGQRSAFDRLQRHSTLQRIYAENRPDREIWLTLCKISDVTLIQDIDTTHGAEITGDEDFEHS